MRRLTVIVIFLVGAVGLSQWLSIGFLTTWAPQLRQYLETIAGRATHTRVTIDAIVPAFFHHVRLTHVTVFDEGAPAEPIFQAGEIELTVSFIDLPRAI